MKLKSKICALSLALVLGCGVLAACNGGNDSKPGASSNQQQDSSQNAGQSSQQTGESSQQQGGSSQQTGGSSQQTGGSSQAAATKYKVNVTASTDYAVDGINADGYEENAKVTFTVRLLNTDKEIVSVGYDSTTLTAQADGSYTFNMPKRAVYLFVRTRAVQKYVLAHSGTIRVNGDPVAFSLTLGTDPVTSFTLRAVEGADKVTINGQQVTGVAEGAAVIAAFVSDKEVARESITVEKANVLTLAQAIEDAWSKGGDFADNSKSTKTSDKYKVRAKIVFMGKVNNNKVEMLLDDGTAIIDYQVTSGTNLTSVAVGDVIEIEEPLQNYYGLIEMSSSAERFITKVTGFQVNTTSFTTCDNAAAFDSVYDANLVNEGRHKVTPIVVNAKSKTVTQGTDTKKRFQIEGAKQGLLATSKSAIDLYQVEDATYTLKGYLLSWNDSYKYSNLIVTEQTKLVATTVAIDQQNVQMTLSGANSTKQLTYTTTPLDAGQVVSWSVAPAGVVTVENGLLTAVAAGNATVKLTVDGHEATTSVRVLSEMTPATAVDLDKTTLNLETGDEEVLTATVTPATSTDDPSWSVAPAGVVTVEQDATDPTKATVKAVTAGTATVTVKYNDNVSKSCTVIVKQRHGTVESDPLTVSEAQAIGAALPGVGGQSVYSPYKYYIKGYVSAITSNDDGALMGAVEDMGVRFIRYEDGVDGSKVELGSMLLIYGEICNYSKGTIQLAHSNAHPVLIKNIDNTQPTFIESSVNSVDISVGGEDVDSPFKVYPASLNLTATLRSEDPAVASIVNGKIHAVAEGKTTVTAIAGSLTASVTVNVSPAGVTVLKATMKYAGGSTTNMAADANNAASVGLDATVFTVSTAKNKASNEVGLNKDGSIRLYANAATGNGTTLTVAIASGYTIKSATIKLASGTATNLSNAEVKAGETVVTPDEGVVAVNGSSFSIQNVAKENKQIWIESIEISYVEGGQTPAEIAQPHGNFSGYAVSATDDSNIFVDLALANEKAFLELGSNKLTTTYTFNKETGLVTIVIDDTYGTFTGTYDESNAKLVNCGIDGPAAATLKNNGSVELASAENYWNLDGTTEELRAQFIRRYRASGASSWTVDNNEEHTDRIVSDTTNFVSGTGAMSVRPYSGSGNAVGLSLKNDFAQAKAIKNIGFWIYNSSANDISLRTWVYTQTGLAGAAEIGGLTAKANGWTYCRMGFDKTIYNFNISNWNGSANALVFDDIVLF